MGRLSNLSRKDIVRKLERLEYEFHEHGANHDVYRHPATKRRAVLPRHAIVKESTLQRMLKQAGIALKDFLDA